MKKTIILLIIFIFCTFLRAQTFGPDLSKKNDLANLGVGLIVKKDGYLIKKIKLHSVETNSIIYEKENNLHDYEFDKIDRLEFPDSNWGPLKVKFENGKPKLYKLF